MSFPTITITSISKTKIGWQSGKDQSIVKFTADQILKDFEARAGGVGRGSGLSVGKSILIYPSTTLYPSATLYPQTYSLGIGIEQQFEVDDEELQQDGDYRINIYGMNAGGEWTPYG